MLKRSTLYCVDTDSCDLITIELYDSRTVKLSCCGEYFYINNEQWLDVWKAVDALFKEAKEAGDD